jgi:hemerythrin-like domain-containing protein
MDAQEVRSRVLSEHAELRGMLDALEPLVARFEAGEDVAAALRERASKLYATFAAHMDCEERLLAPALRDAGPAGERAARHLDHEHREQRELLSYLLGRLEQHSRPTILVARELDNFIGYLRHDMAHEESGLLSEKMLQDR